MKDIKTKENVQLKSNLIRETINPWLNIGDSAYYTVDSIPLSLKRPRFGLGKVYDSQKREKYGVQLQLKSQHDYVLPFDGPLKLEVTFFMPLPQRLRRKHHTGSYPPHHVKPDIDNLVKFILDCANGIIFCDDALISCLVAHKRYSEVPRTEFSITRLEPDGTNSITQKA